MISQRGQQRFLAEILKNLSGQANLFFHRNASSAMLKEILVPEYLLAKYIKQVQ